MSIDICELKNYKRISNHDVGGLVLLRDNLSRFLNCTAKLIVNPIEYFEYKYEINILDNPNRSVYYAENTILLTCKIKVEDDILAYLGIKLLGNLVSYYENSLYEQIANAITRVLSECYVEGKLYHSLFYFDRYFIQKMTVNSLCKGFYRPATITFLFDLLKELSSMTFENEHFASGFILTRNVNDYTQKHIVKDRKVKVISLTNPFNIRLDERFDNRRWKLVDGKNSFYMINRKLESNHILIRDQDIVSQNNFLDTLALSELLYGKDIAFRTFGHNQCSLINSEGVEVINIQNRWRIRDYKALKKYLLKKLDFLSLDANFNLVFIDKLIFYLNYCSLNNRSCIIWIPRDLSKCSRFFIGEYNQIFSTDISIFDLSVTDLLLRCITSDGVSVISHKGIMHSFGNIVDISKVKMFGLKGTGETAVKALATNGLSIKISSDGNIKIYSDNDTDHILL